MENKIRLYEDYISAPRSLSLEQMAKLHAAIADSTGADPDAAELYDELLETAVKYSAYRANWLLWSREKRMENDSRRTSCHDSLIVKFNQLARFLEINGKDAGWRDELGYEDEDPNFRKRIGDFACYIAFVSGLNSR